MGRDHLWLRANPWRQLFQHLDPLLQYLQLEAAFLGLPDWHHSLQQTVPSVVNVKLVQTVMSRQPSGKLSFNRVGQSVDVTEATANVTYIQLVIQQKWGHHYTLVTADGLELEDCQSTQGQDYANITISRMYSHFIASGWSKFRCIIIALFMQALDF